ncbi:anti-sigma B factor antagonist [Stackebrandtia endophytica]|uniref:Anti-sigma factor antagonist n=1 Tax=Stackebrandtia endophytica TaxID=1496996 RepID=A0A543AWE1_9ACTN|nr:STAS domain-containing protein [Stackebrandtia endophytica]TQL76870.1 anti-sigma B factor antagonist [Stackebrandtia endophytica]
MDLELSTKTDGGRTVVSVSGEIDMYTAPTLREYLTALLSDGVKDLAIDVNGVDFCDSTGLGVFIGTLRRLREVDGSLVIVCAREQMLKIFQLTGLHKVFDIQPQLPSED